MRLLSCSQLELSLICAAGAFKILIYLTDIFEYIRTGHLISTGIQIWIIILMSLYSLENNLASTVLLGTRFIPLRWIGQMIALHFTGGEMGSNGEMTCSRSHKEWQSRTQTQVFWPKSHPFPQHHAVFLEEVSLLLSKEDLRDILRQRTQGLKYVRYSHLVVLIVSLISNLARKFKSLPVLFLFFPKMKGRFSMQAMKKKKTKNWNLFSYLVDIFTKNLTFSSLWVPASFPQVWFMQ